MTGPMLAIGHAGKGLFEFGALGVQGGINLFTGWYPEAGDQLWGAIVSMPENIVMGVAQATKDVFSGDAHQATYGATNLFMTFFLAAKVKGIVTAERGTLSLRAGTAAAAEFDASVAATAARSALPSIDDLSRAASTLNRNQLTDAGRALQKHSDRPGSVFSATNSKAVTLNSEEQMIVDNILSNPGTKIVSRTVNENKAQISVIEAVAPDGRAIRFSGDGKRLIGFREPSLK